MQLVVRQMCSRGLDKNKAGLIFKVVTDGLFSLILVQK